MSGARGLKLNDFFPVRNLRRWLPAAFLLGLLAHLPAGFVWRYAQDHVQLPENLSVDAVSGSVWQGEMLLSMRRQPQRLQVSVQWQFGWSALIRSGELVMLKLSHPGTQLQLAASPAWDLSGIAGSLSGTLHPLLVNPILKSNNAWISGEAALQNVRFSWQDSRLQSLDGAVIWQGGDTFFLPPAGSPQLIHYPQLALQMATMPDSIDLWATVLGDSGRLIEASLASDGWFQARVNGRLKQAVPDLPVAVKPADQALISYKEKLF